MRKSFLLLRPLHREQRGSVKPQHIDSVQAHVQISVANVYICVRADRKACWSPQRCFTDMGAVQ